MLCNILAGFVTGYATNYYLNMTLELAFAMLYPEMEILLFFVLPVKMKWIGIAWAVYMAYQFAATNSWAMRAGLLLSLVPFLLFFGKSLWLMGKRALWRMRR